MLNLQKRTWSSFVKCLEHGLSRRSIPKANTLAVRLNDQFQDHQHAGGVFIMGSRHISVSAPLESKKNFRKFHLGNKRGDRAFKQRRHENPELYADMPVETEVKPIGYKYGERFVTVPEMIPELIVPDLKDCELKPYVSYRTADIVQEEFAPQELFNYIYQKKIEEDFKNGKLDAEGNPLEPSCEEKMTAEQAILQARKTGSDIFSERIPKQWECLDNYKLEETVTDTTVYPPDKVPLSEVRRISEKE